jgi:hypothetical protein
MFSVFNTADLLQKLQNNSTCLSFYLIAYFSWRIFQTANIHLSLSFNFRTFDTFVQKNRKIILSDFNVPDDGPVVKFTRRICSGISRCPDSAFGKIQPKTAFYYYSAAARIDDNAIPFQSLERDIPRAYKSAYRKTHNRMGQIYNIRFPAHRLLIRIYCNHLGGQFANLSFSKKISFVFGYTCKHLIRKQIFKTYSRIRNNFSAVSGAVF